MAVQLFVRTPNNNQQTTSNTNGDAMPKQVVHICQKHMEKAKESKAELDEDTWESLIIETALNLLRLYIRRMLQ